MSAPWPISVILQVSKCHLFHVKKLTYLSSLRVISFCYPSQKLLTNIGSEPRLFFLNIFPRVYKHLNHKHKQPDPEQLPVGNRNICSVVPPTRIDLLIRNAAVDRSAIRQPSRPRSIWSLYIIIIPCIISPRANHVRLLSVVFWQFKVNRRQIRVCSRGFGFCS